MSDSPIEVEWDKREYDRLHDGLGKVAEDIDKALTLNNLKWAKRLAAEIRARAPREGQNERQSKGRKNHGHGGKHDTPPGAMQDAIVAESEYGTAAIRAKAKQNPHFYVFEFGGGVWWYNRGGKGGYAAGVNQIMRAKMRKNRKSSRVSYAKLRGTTGFGHIIGIRPRSPQYKDMKLPKSWAIKGGAAGWFFWPTIRKHGPDIAKSSEREAEMMLRRDFGVTTRV